MIGISAATRWSITVDALLETHRRTPLKGVLVASPANPTGTMMRPDDLSRFDRGGRREGIRFISDEIYHGLDYAFPARQRRSSATMPSSSTRSPNISA